MASIVLPLNSSYSHSVTLRNPFPEPLLVIWFFYSYVDLNWYLEFVFKIPIVIIFLQITEALLHGGNHASHTLPSNIDLENAIESWTLQPYETKEILRIHFSTVEAWNLTTLQRYLSLIRAVMWFLLKTLFFTCMFYCSIKLASGTTLLIPVDIEVESRTGLYVPDLKIDFGSGGHLDPPAVRPLHLCSSSKKTVNIEVIRIRNI